MHAAGQPPGPHPSAPAASISPTWVNAWPHQSTEPSRDTSAQVCRLPMRA